MKPRINFGAFLCLVTDSNFKTDGEIVKRGKGLYMR